MKPDATARRPEEIELKLALPSSNPTSLARQLARTSLLARREATHQHLHNVYYDTPEQFLRRERIALRMRRVGSDQKPQWLQTLKTGGHGDSALSQRGEWEASVPCNRLALDVLKATPWSGIDPDGAVFRALAPCFVTSFERTSWSVRRRDGSLIEVALDIGHITAGGKSTPICELELELRAGKPAALFALAEQIARTIAVLPANVSKSERGYALVEDSLDTPLGAQPPKLTSDQSLRAAAGGVLREMFCQFTTNLNTLRTSDDPEVVHQARVGWRRFKSALRLFKPVLAAEAVPSWQALEPLLGFLGELRDLDVALTDTLPPLNDAYVAADPRRADAWEAMTKALRHAADLQRKSVRYALQVPSVGATLLAATRWLEGLSVPDGPGEAGIEPKLPLRPWARQRIARLHKQLKAARKDLGNPDSQHRARILAKRTRYGIEALGSLLPRKRSQRWRQQATSLQTGLGAARDVMQASALAARLEADGGLAEFLRGVAIGRSGLE